MLRFSVKAPTITVKVGAVVDVTGAVGETLSNAADVFKQTPYLEEVTVRRVAHRRTSEIGYADYRVKVTFVVPTV